MPGSLRILKITILALAVCSLAGCGTINEKLTAGLSGVIPQWAGGLPPDAPPRPGTPQYDEFMKERERRRLEPAPPKDAQGQPLPPALDPVH